MPKAIATEAEKVALNKSRAAAASSMPTSTPQEVSDRAKFVARQGSDEAAAGGKMKSEDAQHLSNNAENVQALGSSGLPAVSGPHTYKKGGRIAADGVIMAHKDEEVLPKKEADDYRAFRGNAMSDALGALGGTVGKTMGSKEPVEKKELHIRKGQSGGFIVKHVSADNMNAPEEHVAADKDALHKHIDEHMNEEDNG
jgi:hypothetical protein